MEVGCSSRKNRPNTGYDPDTNTYRVWVYKFKADETAEAVAGAEVTLYIRSSDLTALGRGTSGDDGVASMVLRTTIDPDDTYVIRAKKEGVGSGGFATNGWSILHAKGGGSIPLNLDRRSLPRPREK